MTVVPHAGSRRSVLHRTAPTARGTRTGVLSTSAFAVGALAVMSLGLLALLLLNTALAKGSFRAHELRIQKADLAQREQLLRTQIEAASSPLTLTRRAESLGLVPNVSPVFIRLADGRILGVPYAAGTPLDPATGAPQEGVSPVTGDPATVATDPTATLTDPAATAPTEPSTPTEQAPTESSATSESGTAPGVATAPATGTEQPLGMTGR